MVIALVLSLVALGYCIWLLRRMAIEILALCASLKALFTETQTLTEAFESVAWNLTKPPVTKSTTKKPRARVR